MERKRAAWLYALQRGQCASRCRRFIARSVCLEPIQVATISGWRPRSCAALTRPRAGGLLPPLRLRRLAGPAVGEVELDDLARLHDHLAQAALEHDSPLALLREACRWLGSQRIVRPGLTVLERAVSSARVTAEHETHRAVGAVLHR